MAGGPMPVRSSRFTVPEISSPRPGRTASTAPRPAFPARRVRSAARASAIALARSGTFQFLARGSRRYSSVPVPGGAPIHSAAAGKLDVPDRPILPFIEGDGTGPDIWRASVRVFDAAVAKAYGGKRKIEWMEVYAGEKSFKQFDNWLPDDTIEAFRAY